MLETEIKKLTAAVQELTEVLKQQAAPQAPAEETVGDADSEKKAEKKPARKRGRPRKKVEEVEQPTAAPEAEPPSAPEEIPNPFDAKQAAEDTPEPENVTLDDVMVHMREVAMLLRKLGEEHPVAVQVMKRAQDWVQEHGAAKLTQLDPKHYAAARDMLRDLVTWAEAQAEAPGEQSAPSNPFE